MSKNLENEYQKYGEFYEGLKEVSQVKEEGIDMVDAEKVIKGYKKRISLYEFTRFWEEYEADTAEETEVLQICKEVRAI